MLNIQQCRGNETKPRWQETASRNNARISTRKSSQELTRQEEARKKEVYMPTLQTWLQRADRKNQPYLKHPEYQNVRKRVIFENRCRECDRICRWPVGRRQNQQFVCADIQKTMPAQGNPKETKKEGTEPEEPTTERPGNINHVRGRPRQPKESG